MKTRAVLLVCATLATGTISLQAGNPKRENATTKSKTTAVLNREAQARDKTTTEGELTGSHLKTSYRKRGMITDGANQVTVIDRETIEHSGAADLRELLIRRGLRR